MEKTTLKLDRFLVCMCLVNAISNSGYALIAPFLPVNLKAKGIDVSWFGYIFAMYSVAISVFSPVVAHYLKKY